MLAINNQAKFNEIVKEALAKSVNYPRWQNAINKAVVQIELQPEWITWMPETKSIVIWNQESNKVHSANGVCDCISFEKGFPCFHRSMARLLRLYFEALEAESKPPSAKTSSISSFNNAPYQSGGNRTTSKTERVGNIRI